MSKSKYHLNNAQLAEEEQQVLAAKRDRKRFAVLYDKYYERIYLYVFQRVDGAEAAQDIVSQVFLKAMMNLPQYEFRGLPFGSWLYRIAQNELNLSYRAQKAQKVVSVETEQLHNLTRDMQNDDDGMPEDKTPELIEAIRQLKPKDVEILELRYFEKRSFREVGEILGITENNAKVRIYRVLEKLKNIMLTIKA